MRLSKELLKKVRDKKSIIKGKEDMVRINFERKLLDFKGEDSKVRRNPLDTIASRNYIVKAFNLTGEWTVFLDYINSVVDTKRESYIIHEGLNAFEIEHGTDNQYELINNIVLGNEYVYDDSNTQVIIGALTVDYQTEEFKVFLIAKKNKDFYKWNFILKDFILLEIDKNLKKLSEINEEDHYKELFEFL